MKLIIAADDGSILDTVDITREDWDNLSPIGAAALLSTLEPGPADMVTLHGVDITRCVNAGRHLYSTPEGPVPPEGHHALDHCRADLADITRAGA